MATFGPKRTEPITYLSMQTVAIRHASNKYLFARMNVSQMIEFMGATIWDVCHKVKRVAWHKVFIWLVVPLKGTRERLSTEPTHA